MNKKHEMIIGNGKHTICVDHGDLIIIKRYYSESAGKEIVSGKVTIALPISEIPTEIIDELSKCKTGE